MTQPAEYIARYHKRFPEKVRAWTTAHRALERGLIAPPPDTCPKCGNPPRPRAGRRRGMEMHHYKGYDHPLEIQWLCWTCHSAERRGAKQPSPHVRAVVLKTHCKNGHEYSEANTYWHRDKPWHREKRRCRACHTKRANARNARLRGANG